MDVTGGLINQSVTIEPFVSMTSEGDRAYAAGVEYPARIENVIRMIRNLQGETVVNTSQIFVQPSVPVGYYDKITIEDYADISKSGGAYDDILYPALPGSETLYWRAQQFTPTVPVISSIIVPVYRRGSPSGNLVIEIQSDSSGSPSGTVITTTSLTASDILTEGTDVKIMFTPSQITAGSNYWVCLKSSASWDTDNCVYWKYQTGAFTNSAAAGVGGVFSLVTDTIQFDLVTKYITVSNPVILRINKEPDLDGALAYIEIDT